MKKKISLICIAVLLLSFVLVGCKPSTPDTIRIGFFPNLTHAQALYGYANGDFQKAFGNQYQVKWESFNAGPDELQAIFAGEVDIGYIGPIPAINGYIKSNGDVKIIAGAALNGALLVTRNGLSISSIQDLAGRTVAVPQFGNTQHLCLLNLLSANGLSTTDKGGNVKVIEAANADIKTLMDKGDIDAALVPEPWATRLVKEIGAHVLVGNNQIWDSGDYASTVVVVSSKFYQDHRDLVEKFLQTHMEITDYINKHPDEAMTRINDKIGELTGSKLDADVLQSAFPNIVVTYNPGVASINKFMTIYQEEGFVTNIPDKNGIYNFDVLNSLLKAQNLPEISGAS